MEGIGQSFASAADSSASILQGLERLKESGDGLEKGIAGVGSKLDDVKSQSDLISGMRERLIADIETSVTRTVGEIQRVQAGVAGLDSSYHDLSEQLIKSSAELASGSRSAANAVVEELESQVALLRDGTKAEVEKALEGIGQSFASAADSATSILQGLERLKESGDGLEKGIAGVGSKLDDVKSQSDLISGMRDRLIADIEANKQFVEKVLFSMDSSLKQGLNNEANELYERIQEDINNQASSVRKSYDEIFCVIDGSLDSYLNIREEQIKKQKEISDAEIQILKDMETIIKNDVKE